MTSSIITYDHSVRIIFYGLKMSNIIDPEAIYEPFGNLSIDQLRIEVGKMLQYGVTVRCNDGKDDIIMRSDYLGKSGTFKDIYILNLLSIGNVVYDPQNYILKIRFTANTPEYWNNERSVIPNQGVVPIVMSEGKRYEMIDGEIKKYFADILPTKTHILLTTQNFVVDFIIQERMDMSLDFIRKHNQLPISVIKYIMNKLLTIASSISSKGYTFTNFSPSSVMIKFMTDHVVFKLVNTSFVQRNDMVRIDGNRKLYSTASVAQLSGTEESPELTMLINIIYTCFDLYQPYSLADKINSTCCKDSKDYSCLVQHLISARNQQVAYYANEDKVFADVVNAIRNRSDIASAYSNLMTMLVVNPDVEKKFINIVYDVITSVITFEQSTSDYWNSDAYVYNCDDNDVTSESVKNSYNLFNTASKKTSLPARNLSDESIFSSPVTSVSNLFNTASKKTSLPAINASNLFNTASKKTSLPAINASNLFNSASTPATNASNLFSTASKKTSVPVVSARSASNLFNADDESETVSLRPLFSTSATSARNLSDEPIFSTSTTSARSASRSIPKSSYSVGNLFNEADEDSAPAVSARSASRSIPKSSYSVGNLFNEADDESLPAENTRSVSNLFSTASAPAVSARSTSNLFSTASAPAVSARSTSNIADDESETVSLRPLFSTSESAPAVNASRSIPKSSYSVGNLFNEADEDSASAVSARSASNLFSTASKKTVPTSLFESDESLPAENTRSASNLFSTTSIDSQNSMFDYLNKRIDDLQDDVNHKFDDILERLD